MRKKNKKTKTDSSPERFELSRGNPMYLAGTRLNHSAKATFLGVLIAVELSLLRKTKGTSSLLQVINLLPGLGAEYQLQF